MICNDLGNVTEAEPFIPFISNMPATYKTLIVALVGSLNKTLVLVTPHLLKETYRKRCVDTGLCMQSTDLKEDL